MLDSGAYNLRRATGRPLVRHTRAKLAPTALPLASREDLLGLTRVGVITPPQAAGSSRPPLRATQHSWVSRVCPFGRCSPRRAVEELDFGMVREDIRHSEPIRIRLQVFGGSRPVASPGERTSCANCSNVASLIPGFYGRSHRAPCLTRHVPPL
jgi:hypothetical protein